MDSACFVVLCGLPASGKTSLCKRIVDEGITRGCHVVHVCFDDFIGNVEDSEGDRNGKLVLRSFDGELRTWRECRQALQNCISSLALMFMRAEKQGSLPRQFVATVDKRSACTCLPVPINKGRSGPHRHLILIDDNMYYRSMRYSYYALARQINAAFGQVYMRCTVENSLQRNAERVVPVADDDIRRMYGLIEPPGGGVEHEWEKHCVLLDDPFSSLGAFWQMIEDAFANPPHLPDVTAEAAAKAAAQAITSSSVLHHIDCTLRQCVGGKIRSAKLGGMDVASLRTFSAGLNILRKSLLEDLRSERTLEELLHKHGGFKDCVIGAGDCTLIGGVSVQWSVIDLAIESVFTLRSNDL